MSLREIAQRIFYTFFVVWSLMGIGNIVLSLIFSWRYFYVTDVYASFFLASLTSFTYFVMYSKKELSLKKIFFRLFLQLLLILGIVITIGYNLNWISFDYPIHSIAMIIAVIVIYIFVAAWELHKGFRLADKLNIKLNERTK